MQEFMQLVYNLASIGAMIFADCLIKLVTL